VNKDLYIILIARSSSESVRKTDANQSIYPSHCSAVPSRPNLFLTTSQIRTCLRPDVIT